MLYRLLIGISLVVACHAQAATVFKCVDAKGKVYFTQQNCPETHSLESVENPTNARISGSGPDAVMARPASGSSIKSTGQNFTVVKPEERKNPPGPLYSDEPKRADRSAGANGACVKFVNKSIKYTQRNKNGSTSGVSRMVKVPVPC